MVSFNAVRITLLAAVVAGGGHAAADDAPSFRNEIVPLLTRYGCNMGTCHGKLSGQNGFELSLRGYAPADDHVSLVREYDGRRVDRHDPARSLLLLKPTGAVPHGGGTLFPPGSEPHRLLERWIASGAAGLQDDDPRLERIAVEPKTSSLRPEENVSLSVRADFDDGSTRDVTSLSQFFSGDESVLDVSPGGTATAVRSGEAVVRVHFLDQVEVATVTVPYSHEVEPASFAEGNNAVDEHVFAKLAALRIPPSPVCDDATFVRRVFLDLIGTLPTPEETRDFLADSDPDKRSRLVDELLERPEFVDYWTHRFADLLQNRRERDHDVRGTKGVRAFHAWLRERVAANTPWDELAREVLTATGDSFANPEVGYYVVTVGEKRNPAESEVVDSVAQSFLGTRIGCARCHNHPLEKYTQDDFYAFAGFFARVALDRQKPHEGPTTLFVASEERSNLHRRVQNLERKIAKLEESEEPLSEKDAKQLERQREQLETTRQEFANFEEKPVLVRQPRTGEMLPPRPLDRSDLAVGPNDDPREAFVDWMTDPANESFSGSMVNRLWKHFLGVGLVEPVDDLRPSNPPSNQPLWELLNREFVSSGYDVKHVMRLIVNSRTYQLGSATRPENATEQRFYSHHYARRLPAEVLLDAVGDVTGVPEPFPGYPLGTRAVQLPDPAAASYFLETFGRPGRITACACERDGEVTLPQLLHLQNGDWIGRKLTAADGRLSQLLADRSDDGAVAEELFLVVLSRPPTRAEREAVAAHLAGASDRRAAFVDLFWSLLNTKEFAFQH